MLIIVDALRAEAARAGEFLKSLPAQDFARQTRCPPMNVHELAAHVLRGAQRIEEMIAAGPVDEQPETDGVTYFQYDPAAIGPGVVLRAREAASTFPVAGLPSRWQETWKRSLDLADGELSENDPVLRNVFGGLMKLGEYLRTRAVEVVIHHMDLRDALGLDPDPDPEALDVVCGVLSGLLGTDPRRLGMDAVRFALLGTGRAILGDDESRMLGPLADALPVIS